MREVTIAAIQMSCSRDVNENIEKAAKLIRAAAEAGAQIILPSELFERQYFCQERRYDYYDYAKPLSENAAVQSMKVLAKELGVVIPVSFYEAGEGRQLFNSVAVIDADGEVLGIYRKTHIPDDHYYQEKFYFTPGNTGFKAFKTKYATIGVGICWDQWFPETARGMALKGAEILFYPTAIGSEPILECDSMPHWRRCMTGHAACNLMPVVAANRIGTEEVVPCAENGNQSSALTFYGSSFITDATGEVLGIYRKTHIPDDHYYQEKFYFTPGNTGFKAFKTKYATIGVGICWDQWFPETARGMALKGAEILFYPTAIGSEPILECDSMPHWRRCMTGHAACNLMPVVAANRIGTEEVVPCAENGNQSSALTFYGSSFITDATGEVVEEMDRVSEGFILHSFDLDELESERKSWGLFRDRRPEMYGEN